MLHEQLLEKHGDQRQSVDHMVHPDGDDVVEELGKDELAVNEVQAPESGAHELEAKDNG